MTSPSFLFLTILQFPAASGGQADKSRRKAWIESMRRHMNDKTWQLTRNLYVCTKHFPNGDLINGVPDFGPPPLEDFISEINTSGMEQCLNDDNSIQVVAHSGQDQVEMEEIEVDTADWLPRAVSHQFKEQFIGNDPRYVVIRKDNTIASQNQKMTTNQREVIYASLSNKEISQATMPDGKENTMIPHNEKIETKKFIETENGELYEILSVEEPQEMVNIYVVQLLF